MLKRNELLSHGKTWIKLKCTLLSKRSQTEKATYCLIPIIWHSEKSKPMETVKRSVFAKGWVWGGGGWTDRAEQRMFRAAKLLCTTRQSWTHVAVHLSNPWNAHHDEWPGCERWTLTMMTCQRRFINCHRCTPAAWDLDSGKVVIVWRQGTYVNLLYLPLVFAVNLKLL